MFNCGTGLTKVCLTATSTIIIYFSANLCTLYPYFLDGLWVALRLPSESCSFLPCWIRKHLWVFLQEVLHKVLNERMNTHWHVIWWWPMFRRRRLLHCEVITGSPYSQNHERHWLGFTGTLLARLTAWSGCYVYGRYQLETILRRRPLVGRIGLRTFLIEDFVQLSNQVKWSILSACRGLSEIRPLEIRTFKEIPLQHIRQVPFIHWRNFDNRNGRWVGSNFLACSIGSR